MALYKLAILASRTDTQTDRQTDGQTSFTNMMLKRLLFLNNISVLDSKLSINIFYISM